MGVGYDDLCPYETHKEALERIAIELNLDNQWVCINPYCRSASYWIRPAGFFEYGKLRVEWKPERVCSSCHPDPRRE